MLRPVEKVQSAHPVAVASGSAQIVHLADEASLVQLLLLLEILEVEHGMGSAQA